ncbi:MAG: leucine-rich repeat domain-containing protein [Bacteroidaceae bacterium]|nr:leucine-rich repeat domain-containing protein [Bacteroidaceae bacterium]
MKHPYFKTILLCFCMFASINAFAEAIEINGIYYNLDFNQKTAEVTKNPFEYKDKVKIPETVAFKNTNYSVTSIGDYAFYDDFGLTSVTIGNSVTSIGGYAFANCSGLTSVTIPNSVISIGGFAFSGCSGLTSVTIPNSVTSIGKNAFYRCTGLTSVTIGNSVTSIAGYVFYNCSALTSVTIGNSVKSIGEQAFYGCSGLASITIPNSVTSIGDYAFYECGGLTSVNIGNGVKSIGGSAFANCAELTDVYCYAEKVPTTKSDAFAESYIEYATLHVPAASVEQYKATAPWSDFGTIVATDGTTPEPPTPEKCATPTISYSKGELTFSCNTEGAEFISEIKDADIKKHYTASVSLTATYNISVYATKVNYENSDTIQATLCWIEQQPQTEGITDEDAVAEVQAVPVLIQTQGNTINVEGAEAGTEIILYGTNGVQLDSVIATTGTASLNASGLSGSVAIVKIGNKTVKVLMKQ